MTRYLLMLLLAALAASSATAQQDTPTLAQAKQQGATQCVPQIGYLSSLMTQDQRQSALSKVTKVDGKDRLFTSQISIEYTDAKGFIGLTVVPRDNNECDVTYTRILIVEISCIEMRKSQYQGWTVIELPNALVLQDQQEKVQAFLMPAGNSCVAIHSQMGIAYKPPSK